MQAEKTELVKWQASLRAIKYALHVLDGPRDVADHAEELVDEILRDLDDLVASNQPSTSAAHHDRVRQSR